MIIAVCGGDTANEEFVRTWLDGFHAGQPITEIRHGGTPGVSRQAEGWALLRGITVQSLPLPVPRIHGADRLLAFRGGLTVRDAVATAWDMDVHVSFAGWRPTWAPPELTMDAPPS